MNARFDPDEHPRSESGRFVRKEAEESPQGTETLPAASDVSRIKVTKRDRYPTWKRKDDGHEVSEWWLERDGKTVAYMKTHTYPDARRAGARLVLCDIEVREEYRGQGLARTLIEHVESETGERMHTTGSFTPLGSAAFSGKMPVLPGHDEGVMYDDMTFVVDWENQFGPS